MGTAGLAQRTDVAAKIAELLGDVDPTSTEEVLDVARKFSERRKQLATIFDEQIARLKQAECPRPILEQLKNQRDQVLAYASKQEFGESDIPFIPVIPLLCRGVHDLMPMIRNGDRIGTSKIHPTNFSGGTERREPYFIFCVQRSRVTRGGVDTIPIKVPAPLMGRRPLDVSEVIALTFHVPELLKESQGVVALGTTSTSKDVVDEFPTVYRNLQNEVPTLSMLTPRVFNGEHNGRYPNRWVMASCSSCK